MDTLGCIHAWLIWQEQEEQLEVPHIQISAIPGLAILILLLAPLADLHPVIAAQLLTRGSRGQDVVQLQNDLKQAGCFPGGVRSTGYYGKITKNSVKKLQRTQGLTVDGVVGEQTRSALNSGKTCKSLASSGVLKVGSRGQRVFQLQAELGRSGFQVKKDGIFGRETRAAVIRFQNDRNLKPDGIIGPKTTKLLLIPRTQFSQTSVISDKKISMSWLESQGTVPTLKEFNNLKNRLKKAEKMKRYEAALNLAYIWTKQISYKDEIANTYTSTNLYDPQYPAIVVSVTNPKNRSQLERLQEEKLPIDLLLSIFDNAIEEFDKEYSKPQQFLMAVFRTKLLQTPTEKVMEILSKNLTNFNLDLNFRKFPISEEDLTVSITEHAFQSLSIISYYYPQAVTNYWSNNRAYYNSLDRVYYKSFNKDNSLAQKISFYNFLGNLAAKGDKEALKRLKALIDESRKRGELNENNLEIFDKIELALLKIGIERERELKKIKNDVVAEFKKAQASPDTRVNAASELVAIGIQEDRNLQDEVRTVLIELIEKEVKSSVELERSGFDPNNKLCILANLATSAKKSLQQVSEDLEQVLKKSKIAKNLPLEKAIRETLLYIENPSVNYPFLIGMCTWPGSGPGTTIADEGSQALVNILQRKSEDNSKSTKK
jgi:peptidoglycan hydrolase-like protein with peptidoglycan-binding domain